MVFLFQQFKLNVQFPFQNNISNIPAEFHFLKRKKKLVSEPSFARQAEPNQAVRRQARKCCQRVLGWGDEGWYRDCGRQPREDIFQQPKKMREAVKGDSRHMYVMARCRHRCQNRSFQLKIESGHLATNMRCTFDFESDWYTNHNTRLKRIRKSNRASTPLAS